MIYVHMNKISPGHMDIQESLDQTFSLLIIAAIMSTINLHVINTALKIS